VPTPQDAQLIPALDCPIWDAISGILLLWSASQSVLLAGYLRTWVFQPATSALHFFSWSIRTTAHRLAITLRSPTMLGLRSTLAFLFIILHSLPLAIAQNVTWQTAPFNPPAFPLVVKSPYTSVWAAGATAQVARQWPYFGTTAGVSSSPI
jgi:hypothetical protein